MTTARRIRTGVAKQRGTQMEMEGRRSVTVEAKHKKDTYFHDSREEGIESAQFGPNEHPAMVGMGAGLTLKMGQFESLRIDAWVTLPCRPDEVVETQERASQYVADALAEEETNWLGSQSKTKRG